MTKKKVVHYDGREFSGELRAFLNKKGCKVREIHGGLDIRTPKGTFYVRPPASSSLSGNPGSWCHRALRTPKEDLPMLLTEFSVNNFLATLLAGWRLENE